MNIGLLDLIIIAVIICVVLLVVVGGSGLVVWVVTHKQRQDEPSDPKGPSSG